MELLYTFILFLLTFLAIFFPDTIYRAYKRIPFDKEHLKSCLLVSIAVSVSIAILLGLINYVIENPEAIRERHAELKTSNYRYITTFDSKAEAHNYLENISHQRYSCKEGFKVTTNWYNEITLDKDMYSNDTSRHLFCLDKEPHVNQTAFFNEKDYVFAQSFFEYPSNRLITEFCELDEAVVVDNNKVPVRAINVTFQDNKRRLEEQTHLYCLNTK